MIHAIDVLKVLDAFEALVDRKNINDDAKKAISRELLASVPQEIMAPGCRNTSEAVRSIIGTYLGIKNDRRNSGNGGNRTAEEETRKTEEGRGAREAPKAGSKSEESSSREETMPAKRPEVEREAPQAHSAVAGPGMESQEARTDEKRQARKATGGSRRNS